jgi:epoxyqueuosine reductase
MHRLSVDHATRYTGAVVASLTVDLLGYARGVLGFDLAGVAPAVPLAGAARLREWLAAGRHGEMLYMADTGEIRGDPSRLLPGARSVLCVAMSYHDPPEPAERSDDGVVVARYARRRDYHRVLKRRLVSLGRFLAALVPGARWRAAVDSAPVLERELAWRAGLGWIGRNTCLINRGLGSELLLGELLTDVELEPGAPVADHCGSCRACLDACPTGAFTSPGALDARRCIAYLTIEHRSALPPGLARALGSHLFGCDICQAVCPWNRHAAPSCNPALAARPDLARLSAPSLGALDEPGWLALVAGTPLRRLDHGRFQRNLEAVRENVAGRGE